MALHGRSLGERQVFSLECLCLSESSGEPLALDGAELVTLGEAECVELKLELEGLACILKTSSELSDWPVMLLTSADACDDKDEEEYLLNAG